MFVQMAAGEPALSQRFSRPERQNTQCPQVQPSQGTPTRRPIHFGSDVGTDGRDFVDTFMPRPRAAAALWQFAIHHGKSQGVQHAASPGP